MKNIKEEELDFFCQGLLGFKLPKEHNLTDDLLIVWQHGFELSGYYDTDTLILNYDEFVKKTRFKEKIYSLSDSL